MALLRSLILSLLLVPSLFAAVGSWNGVAFTHWNGIAQTAWNGTAISCAGGGDVTFSSVASAQATGPVSPWTFNFQVTNSLTSGYIIVQTAGWSSDDATTNSAVTCDLAPMALLGKTNVDNFGEYRVYTWGLKTNKASGTYTISVTHTYVGGSDELNGGAMAFDNVNTSTPVGTAVGASGTSTSAAVGVGSASGDMVAVQTLSGANHSAGGGETERWDQTAAIDDGASGMTEAATTTTTTMTTTISSSTLLTHGVAVKK